MSDPLMQVLAGLPTATLGSERADRIRRSCRARLVRDGARASRPTISFAPVWRLVVAALGAAYVIVAILEAVRAYRFS